MSSSGAFDSQRKHEFPVDRYDGDDDSLTLSIFYALESETNLLDRNPDFALYDYIDPSALQMLYDHPIDAEWTFEFDVEEHAVVVRSDGTVVVQ